MKRALLPLAMLLAWQPTIALAANYFVDAVLGNDSYTGTAPTFQNGGTNAGPWRTITRANAATLAAGDAVLFRCGQSWRGTLRVASSPSATNPIRYSRYGSDCNDTNKPTITASDVVTGWQPYAGNIYVATITSTVAQVFVDGAALRLAQYPNPDYQVHPSAIGYLLIDTSLSAPLSRNTIEDTELAAIASQDLVGAGVHIRVNDFTINDRVIGSFDTALNRLTLTQNVDASLRANWGYYLDNKLWMLDEPGEFWFDGSNPAAMRLYVWMPDGNEPGNRVIAGSNAYAIDATSASNVVIEAMRAAKVGAGVGMSLSNNVTVRTMDIEDSYFRGIVVNSATFGTIDSCNIRRSVREGIQMGTSSNFKVLNNRIIDSGVIGSPVQTRGAIQSAGFDNQIKGNTIINSGYHGIAFGKRADVANNRVENACLVMADCGGIYTGNSVNGNDSSPHNSIVYGNTVIGVRGSRNGRDPNSTQVLTPGIYIDYRTSSVYVAANTVSNADMGMFIHVANGITVNDNTFHDWDTYAIRLKEYSFIRITTPSRIQRNKFFGGDGGPAFIFQPGASEITGMATFDSNRYSALYATNPATPEIAKVTTYLNGVYRDTDYNFPEWQGAGHDPQATLFNPFLVAPFAFAPINGTNLVSNGSFDSNTADWIAWAAQGDSTLGWTSDCQFTGCVALSAGAASPYGSLISPIFPVEPGKTYAVSFRDRSLAAPLPLMVVPRMAGPRTYEIFQDRYTFSVGGAWLKHTALFTVSPTLVIEPGDLGGRVDFVAPQNQAVLLDEIRVEEVTYSANDPQDDALLLTNSTSFVGSFSCPTATTDPLRCAEYVYFNDGASVSWPVSVPARASTILVWAGNPFRAP